MTYHKLSYEHRQEDGVRTQQELIQSISHISEMRNGSVVLTSQDMPLLIFISSSASGMINKTYDYELT